MLAFKHREVGKAFFSEICDNLEKGESCVLLGPRYSGRRHSVRAVQEQLPKGRLISVRVNVRFSDPPSSLDQIRFTVGENAARQQGNPIEWIQLRCTGPVAWWITYAMSLPIAISRLQRVEGIRGDRQNARGVCGFADADDGDA